MSKVLLFSDLHASFKQLSNLDHFFAKNSDIKIAIFAGDFLNMGEPLGFANQFFKVFEDHKVDLLWVPGNNDFGREFYKLKSCYPSLEGRVVELGKRKFCGVGGSPASWEGQYAGEKMIERTQIAESIFISHVPPPGLLNYQKNDLDSPLLKQKKSDSPDSIFSFSETRDLQTDELISKRKIVYSPLSHKKFSDAPLVHICGHLHSQWGCALLGQTKVVKLAPLLHGHYAIMNLDDLSIDFRRFYEDSYLR